MFVIITGFLCFAPLPSLGSIVIRQDTVCGKNELACADGTCISQDRVCDGSRDCLDGRDESHCLTNPQLDIFPEPYLVHRSKRQTSGCGKFQWRCKDGTCINFDGKCDGTRDCEDGSDETHALCRGMNCQSFWFRCTYGACVDGDAACNGHNDCVDASDEIGPQCRSEKDEVNNQFKCDNGQRIASSDKCDGVVNCADGSDETLRVCANVSCPSYFFQCAYGACVNQGSNCNGVQECADGSDESADLCGDRIGTPGQNTGCTLPPYPKNGHYLVKGSPHARPGEIRQQAELSVVCNNGFGLANMQPKYYCINGGWINGLTVPSECVRLCQLNLTSEAIEYSECVFPGSQMSVRCTPKIPSGTTVVMSKCREPNYYNSNLLPEMNCIDGQWDINNALSCRPDCGKVTPNILPLVVNGTSVEYAELPWHAGVYWKNITFHRNICGGTIVKNDLVISAAHCFWDVGTKTMHPANEYAVAAGKIYSPWDEPKDIDAQKSEVERLETHQSFHGQDTNYAFDIALLFLATPFTFKPYIRPVCLNFDVKFENSELVAGKMGTVAGWGLTTAAGKRTGVLKTTKLPFVPEKECIEKAPFDFKSVIGHDKICAGYNDGSTTLCQGDSGGGLVFPSQVYGVQRYYLRGVVSTSPVGAGAVKCNVNAIVAFTRVSAHAAMIRPHVRDVL